jgi:hypothetical protein
MLNAIDIFRLKIQMLCPRKRSGRVTICSIAYLAALETKINGIVGMSAIGLFAQPQGKRFKRRVSTQPSSQTAALMTSSYRARIELQGGLVRGSGPHAGTHGFLSSGRHPWELSLQGFPLQRVNVLHPSHDQAYWNVCCWSL